jgi:hypothetical protein
VVNGMPLPGRSCEESRAFGALSQRGQMGQIGQIGGGWATLTQPTRPTHPTHATYLTSLNRSRAVPARPRGQQRAIRSNAGREGRVRTYLSSRFCVRLRKHRRVAAAGP